MSVEEDRKAPFEAIACMNACVEDEEAVLPVGKIDRVDSESLAPTDTDGEEACCRICRCGSEEGRELFHPCICTGSIRYVHEDCLLEWLSRIGSNNKSKCELCGHQFGFRPVYSPDAPKSLSGLEMLKIFMTRLLGNAPYGLRLVLVVCAWGGFVPQVSCLIFRNLSLGFAQMPVKANETTTLGQVYSFLLDWCNFNFGEETISSWRTGVAVTAAIVSSFLVLLIISEFVNGWNELHPGFDEMREAQQVEGNDNHGGREVVNEDEILGGNRDQEEFEFDDDIPDMNLALDGFFGLRGSLLHFIYHVLGVVFLNGIYMFCMYYLPTRTGSLAVRRLDSIMTKIVGIKGLTDEDVLYLQGRPIGGVSVANDFSSVMAEAADVCIPGAEDSDVSETFWASLRMCLLEVGSFSVGLGLFVMTLAMGQLLAEVILRNAVTTTAKALWRNVRSVFHTAVSTMKVAVLIVLKMGVFPVGLGLFLELCCRQLFTFTLTERLVFVLERPLHTVVIFWVAGITHMLVITVLVVELRGILHPDVLKGIIRAHDPNVNLFRILLVEPFTHHLRRMVISCTIYTVLIVLFVRLPLVIIEETKLLEGSSWYPIQPGFSYFSMELQLPFELTIFHFMALHVLDYTKPSVVWAQSAFVARICSLLGLKEYLLPRHDAAKNLLPRKTPNFLVPRLLALMVLSWALCLVLVVATVAAPFIAGMQLRDMLKFPIVHPPHVYFMGCFVIWRLIVFMNGLRSFVKAQLARTAGRRLSRGLHWTVLMCLVLGALPSFLGFVTKVLFLLPPHELKIQYPLELSFSGFSQVLTKHVYLMTDNGTISSLIMNEWMMGVVILFASQQILQSEEISAKLGDTVYAQHVKFMDALEDLRALKCEKMLNTVILASVTTLILLISSALVLTCAWDYLLYCTVGVSLCKLYGLSTMMRWSVLLILLSKRSNYFMSAARKRLKQTHDALRDYQYLAGRQLLNMEKRYSSKKRLKKRDVM